MGSFFARRYAALRRDPHGDHCRDLHEVAQTGAGHLQVASTVMTATPTTHKERTDAAEL
jgi:hypothetical protein